MDQLVQSRKDRFVALSNLLVAAVGEVIESGEIPDNPIKGIEEIIQRIKHIKPELNKGTEELNGNVVFLEDYRQKKLQEKLKNEPKK